MEDVTKKRHDVDLTLAFTPSVISLNHSEQKSRSFSSLSEIQGELLCKPEADHFLKHQALAMDIAQSNSNRHELSPEFPFYIAYTLFGHVLQLDTKIFPLGGHVLQLDTGFSLIKK